MKKILFIIPSLKTGGTNASLEALYSLIKGNYNISVFAISHQPRNRRYVFDNVLLPQDFVLSHYYADLIDQTFFHKTPTYFLKLLKKIGYFWGIDFGAFLCRRTINKLEKKDAYDVIIGYEEGIATFLASMFSKSNKIAWIHCNYDMYLSEGKTEEIIYSVFRKVVCVSEYTSGVFAKRYPKLVNNVIAIHNVSDYKRILNMSSIIIDDERFESEGVRIITAGRFTPVKRFRFIPFIASQLKAQGVQFKWYILGPSDGSDEITIYNNKIKEYNVSDCVIWLGGKANPYPYFKSSTIYVCTSESEACPMVFIEAKILGLPVVTTDFPSSYEFINEGDGIITSIDNMHNGIIEMLGKIENGFHINSKTDVNQESIERICKLFNNV